MKHFVIMPTSGSDLQPRQNIILKYEFSQDKTGDNNTGNHRDEIDLFLDNLFDKILAKKAAQKPQSHRVYKKSFLDGGEIYLNFFCKQFE